MQSNIKIDDQYKNKDLPEKVDERLKKVLSGISINKDTKSSKVRLKGDSDGIVLIGKVDETTAKRGGRNALDPESDPKENCGGEISYVAFLHLSEEDLKEMTQIDIDALRDALSDLKETEAKASVKCVEKGCSGNKNYSKCEYTRWSSTPTITRYTETRTKVAGGEKVDEKKEEFAWIQFGWRCKCEKPPKPKPREEGPITGPGKNEENKDSGSGK